MKLKFKKGDYVLVKVDDDFLVGQIDAYDVFSKKYLVFCGNDWEKSLGDLWCKTQELSLAPIKEMKDE